MLHSACYRARRPCGQGWAGPNRLLPLPVLAGRGLRPLARDASERSLVLHEAGRDCLQEESTPGRPPADATASS